MPDQPPNTDGWLNRREVAKRLAVSETTVRRREEKGDLTPVVVGDAHLFDPKEVEAVRQRALTREAAPGEATLHTPVLPDDSPGKVAAGCFRLFEKGYGVVEVVQQLELLPEQVRALYRQWWFGDTEPAPPPPVIDDREQEAMEKKWREEMDRVYSAWEKELEAKWRPKRRPR